GATPPGAPKDRHMSRSLPFSALAALFVLAAGARAQDRDLREQYGTRSLEAAQHVHRGIQFAQAVPLLKKNEFVAEAATFAKLAASLSGGATTELPALPKPGKGEKLSAAEVYQKAAWSVVLVKTAKGSGSGVCVGREDVILTNHHVVEGSDDVEVYPFII